MTILSQLDTSLLLFVNGLPHTPLLNQMFLFFSFYPIVIWGMIGCALLLYEFSHSRRFFVPLLISLLLSGIVATVFLKPIFGRMRPDISHPTDVIVVAEKSALFPAHNDYSFPSGHAAIAWAGAYVLSRQKKKYRLCFFALALLTSFSRMYLGKHYLSDVIAGGLVGYVMGYITLWILRLQK